MKNIFLLCCCCMNLHIMAQHQEMTSDTLQLIQKDTLTYSPYPQGCYMSLEEILDKTPSQQMEVGILRRTEADISFGGGSDYKLIPLQRSIKARTLKKEVWAVSNGTDLFLNAYKFGPRIWYAKVTTYGQYLTFRIGLGISRKLYVFNTESGKVRQVNKNYMRFLLTKYPDLLQAFEAEHKKNDLSILEKYIQEINNKLSNSSPKTLTNPGQGVQSDSTVIIQNSMPVSPEVEGDIAFTVGILEGGSLIGAELEVMVAEQVGIEGGIGFRGFNLGLNYHFKDKLRSHALNIFLINQGFSKTFSQRLLGAGITLRGKKGLTGHLGLAYATKRSEALADTLNSDIVLSFSFGFYGIIGGK